MFDKVHLKVLNNGPGLPVGRSRISHGWELPMTPVA